MALTRLSHPFIFALISFLSICTIVTSGILVGQYNRDHDAPNSAINIRCRFLLFCGLWTFFFSILYMLGVLFAATSILFSIASHLSFLVLTLILFLSGSAALTASVRGEHFPHQNRLEILVGFSWADTVLLFLAIILVLAVGTKRGDGMRGSLV